MTLQPRISLEEHYTKMAELAVDANRQLHLLEELVEAYMEKAERAEGILSKPEAAPPRATMTEPMTTITRREYNMLGAALLERNALRAELDGLRAPLAAPAPDPREPFDREPAHLEEAVAGFLYHFDHQVPEVRLSRNAQRALHYLRTLQGKDDAVHRS